MISPLAKVKRILTNNPPPEGLDGILISSATNITYLTNYSGFSKEEREAFLFITKNHQYILTDGRYSEAVKNKIKNFKLIEISSKNSFLKSLKYLKTKHNITRLGIEENNLTVKEYKMLRKYYNDTYHYSRIDSLRKFKNEDEVSNIEKACKLGDKAFDYILKKIRLEVSEKELAFEIEFFIKKHGADISFPPIVAFGANSAIPHHRISDKKLEISNKIVLLDFGAKVNNYCSDMTRTVFLGKATAKQKRMYQTVLNAQKLAIEFLKSSIINHKSISAKAVDKVARDYIISKGYQTIPHSVGHGIGLEVHEAPHLSPKSNDILKERIVFSIEPGIYIPNFGGVRIEDLVLLTKSGPKLLTNSSKNIIKI